MDVSKDRLVRKGDYIYGSFIRPESVDGYINGVNPGDRSDVLGRFAFSERSVNDAVDHARLAARIWRRVGLNDRAAVLRRFRSALTKSAERVVRLITRETGKPFWEARQELANTLIGLEHLLDHGMSLLAPKRIEQALGRADYMPRGALALVCPYIQPVQVTALYTAASVLTGNTIVYKPSKFTPGLGQLIAELWDQCKLPRGVVNMVQGSGSGVGRRLVTHPGIAGMLFVGSFETSMKIRQLLFERPELPAWYQTGGKGTAVVLDGCELDRAVYEVLVGAFMSAGQRPDNTARVIVQAGVYEAFVDALVRRTISLEVGYGFDQSIFMGPVISEKFRSAFRRYGRTLSREGHNALVEGTSQTRTERRGFYVTPAIHKIDWTAGKAWLTEEPPGPILQIYRVNEIDEAIALHNQCAARRVTALFPPPDTKVLQDVVDRLRTGSVLINQATTSSTQPLPSTGLGRASSGEPDGVHLVRTLTYARAVKTTEKAFDPAKVLPGTNWRPMSSEAQVEFDEDTIVDDDISLMLEPEV
ncbi:MAG: aldehyde dehydrogenase family protein [Alphaproteobacteria bacterium]|nr:aldehyde dehydrogenase family protein [Alphaproteobacteria bacterium]MCB9791494.1 aldehyde dehydrogenase family protein [Alphaproteobacteria bacterium]